MAYAHSRKYHMFCQSICKIPDLDNMVALKVHKTMLLRSIFWHSRTDNSKNFSCGTNRGGASSNH